LALLKTWSRRKREAERATSGVADVYRYDLPSAKLREQVRQLIDSTVSRIQSRTTDDPYEGATSIMRKELGRQYLSNKWFDDYQEEFDLFISTHGDVDEWLSAVEVIARLIIYYARQLGYISWADDFIEELNAWMLEDGFGYQIEEGQVVQINSKFLHSEAVVPTLRLLSDPAFAGANAEFRQAHAEFRAGEYEDCIHDCCNAFESVLKVILDKKGWAYHSTDTAKKLLDVAFVNNLIPAHMQNSFTGLRTILESGVPTVRNKTAGHGAGASPRNIPKYIAEFQMHQTAAAILLLVEAAK
jgi:hypothetical protein